MLNTAVVGGGPAGMLAAYFAAKGGEQVTLIEQNEKLGKKLFLTGKGRCNITNSCPREEFFPNILTNPKFLYSAFARFSNEDIVALLNQAGLKTKEERGGRVFPLSDHSSDVIAALQKLLKEAGVLIRLNTRVTGLIMEDGAVYGLFFEGREHAFDRVIIATGGLSYPSTGSRGDGYGFAKAAGHSVTPLYPSLIPILCRRQDICKRLQGLTLKNVTLSYFEKGKKRYSELGEMLFTHFGISGPLALSASANVKDYSFQDAWAEIDLKPGLDEKTLHARLLRDFEKFGGKQIKNALFELLPHALAPEVIALSGIDPEKSVGQVSKAERERLVQTLKAFRLDITGTRGIDEAIVTRGGVNVREIDPSTMESKRVKNLFFAGEILDVDGYTGGFNLQIAYSTGALAGKTAN